MKLLLASNSPRRKELLQGLGIPFNVFVLQDIDESYPADLPVEQVAEYISRKKAQAYLSHCKSDQSLLLLTADTVVVCDGDVLGKPHDEQEAYDMLRQLSGKTHQVYTGYCLTPLGVPNPKMHGGSVCTDVTFKNLTDDEIYHYIRTYKPFDKAGAYGIQEWIGYIGITGINGSYYNVMGLPVQRIYEEIKKMHNS